MLADLIRYHDWCKVLFNSKLQPGQKHIHSQSQEASSMLTLPIYFDSIFCDKRFNFSNSEAVIISLSRSIHPLIRLQHISLHQKSSPEHARFKITAHEYVCHSFMILTRNSCVAIKSIHLSQTSLIEGSEQSCFSGRCHLWL